MQRFRQIKFRDQYPLPVDADTTPINPVNSKFAGDEDDKVNAIIPALPTTLKQCASPGFFYSAYTPQDITNAMQDMFAQSLAAARLTQ
jgi:hypothetical protein